MIIFRPPTEADLKHVAAHMRALDALECRVIGDHDPLTALRDGVAQSAWAFAAEVDGETVCIFGVVPESLLADEASPWLLCVNGIERYAKAMLIGTRAYLARMKEEYETLTNYVHADNRHAIRYLKWCGFTFGKAMEWKGEQIIPFSMDCRVGVKAAA